MQTVDNLDIQISTSLKNTDKQLDNLIKRLSVVNSSLSRIKGDSLSGLANGVSRIATSMNQMSDVKTAEFSRLARNIEKLGNLNISSINSVSSSINHLGRGLNQLGQVSDNAVKIGEFAKNISKLGSANIEKAVQNIPLLAKSFLTLTQILSKAPAVSKNVIDLANSMSNLASQGSKVSSATNGLQKGMGIKEASAKKTTKSFKGLASAIGKFYASYFLVIRGIKGLYKSIEGTADYLEAFNYFEVSFNKIAREWKQDYSKFGYESAEAYEESFSKRAKESLSKLSGVQVSVGADGKGLLTETGIKNLGLNIQEITQYASQLASVTNSIGQTGEVSLRTSNAFTKLAGDISSLFNQDYSAVAKNLQSGLIGQSRALYKYGIDITNATLQTYAYNLGIQKNVSEMTQAEKMQLRMIAILEKSKVSWGDLANTINSPSNMLRQFKNNLKEAGMKLGQLFIPLLQRVLPVINGATIAIKNLLGNIAGFLGIKLDLDAFGQSGSDAFDDMSDSLDDVAESANKAKKSLRGFDELKTISTGSGYELESTLDLTNEIIKATEEYEKAWADAYAQMENKANIFAKNIENMFIRVGNALKNSEVLKSFGNSAKAIYEIYATVFSDILKKFVIPFGKDFSKYLIPTLKDFALEFAKTTETLYTTVSEKFKTIWEDASPSLETFSSSFTSVMETISSSWSKNGNSVFESIRTTIKNLGELAVNVWNTTLSPVWKNLTEEIDNFAKKHLSPLIANVSDFVSAFVNAALLIYNKFGIPIAKMFQDYVGPALAGVANSILDFSYRVFGYLFDVLSRITYSLTNVINFLTGVFTGDWKKAWESVKNIFKNTMNGFLDILETMLNIGIIGINNFLNGFTTVSKIIGDILKKEIKIPQIKEVSIPRINAYETGGFPQSASLFWANENGVPELVGTMGGKTAVASGGEITGIKDAIYSTGQQETNLMQTMVGLLRVIAEKEYGITDDQIGKSAQRYARDYFNRTGEEAYSY